jgi:hypothetical protein
MGIFKISFCCVLIHKVNLVVNRFIFVDVLLIESYAPSLTRPRNFSKFGLLSPNIASGRLKKKLPYGIKNLIPEY